MATSPVLETARLRIAPFPESLLSETYVEWLNDPEVVRYSEQRFRRHTLESCRAYWSSFEGTPHHFWALTERGGGARHIGNMNAWVDESNGVADVGILLGEKSLWGRGYGLEAWSAVCSWLLQGAGMRKVTAGTLEVNTGMLRIMEKAGMVDDGIRRKQVVWEGRAVDMVHRALFASGRYA